MTRLSSRLKTKSVAGLALRRVAGIGLATSAVLVLAGCNAVDPLYTEGQWHPLHANHANLVVMAAYPSDLVHGTGEATTDGQVAASAVQRLYDNKVKKLPQSSLSTVGGNGGSGE